MLGWCKSLENSAFFGIEWVACKTFIPQFKSGRYLQVSCTIPISCRTFSFRFA